MEALWEKLEFEKGCFINAGKCQVRLRQTMRKRTKMKKREKAFHWAVASRERSN